jgi:hypothetical protein
MAHGVHEKLLQYQVQLELGFVVQRILPAKAGDFGGQPLEFTQVTVQ